MEDALTAAGAVPLRQMRMPDGTRIAYRLYGLEDAHQAPARVVLCDGISCDRYIWRHLLPALAERAAVLHVNYRGHGRSGLPRAPADCTLAHLAADVDVLLISRRSKPAVRLTRFFLPPLLVSPPPSSVPSSQAPLRHT